MRVNSFSIFLLLSAYFLTALGYGVSRGSGHGPVTGPMPVNGGPTVRKDERWPLVSSEYGEISAVKISDGSKNGFYYLQFITMYPGSLFLPVYLHSEMVLYVNSGSGTLSWIDVEKDDDKLQQVMLHRGDIFSLSSKTVFYLQNNANNVDSYDYQPQTLQIHAIFPGSEVELKAEQQLAGVYTGIHELVLGFDDQVLQSTFSVPVEVIEELRRGEGQPLIVEGKLEANTSICDDGTWGIRTLLGTKNNDIFKVENKKKAKKGKKSKKAYNIFNEERDVENCFGWSVTVTKKELEGLKDTDLGVFMVNLNKGSMMGPHWNPNTAEIAVVLQGQGIIQVVCPGIASETGCTNLRFTVEEGDVFVVPRYHPMAQISFNNDSFVFMGFMLEEKKESAQYLMGKYSILQWLDRKVLAKSFNVKNSTIDWILSDQSEKIIYECTSCAEEEGGGGGDVPQEEGGGRWPGEEGRRRGGGRWPEEEGERGGGGMRPEHEGRRGGGGGWQEPQRKYREVEGVKEEGGDIQVY